MDSPNIRAVIFDVGGVLLRTHDWSGRHRWDDRFRQAHGTAEEFVFNSDIGQAAQLGQFTTEDLWKQIGQYYQLTTKDLAAFRQDFWRGDRFDFELADYIRSLRPRYQTAIISNAPDDLRQVLTEEFQVADAFDLIVVSAEEKTMKPAAVIYERTLERLGVSAAQSVFIDDSPTNIKGAQAVGMHTIHFTADTDVPEELAKLGVAPK